MAKCNYCGTTILFGGKRDGDLRFCNDKCQQEGMFVAIANQIPTDIVQQYINEVRVGKCPQCHGRGPVDVHTSYEVWSALVLTSWSSTPRISCRSCGVKHQLTSALSSLLLGWWSFPGIIMTPIQLIRNLVGMFRGPDPARPSAQLENLLRLHLAMQIVEKSQRKQDGAEHL